MSETQSTKRSTTIRIPAIIMERPPLVAGRMALGLLLGLLLGLVMGLAWFGIAQWGPAEPDLAHGPGAVLFPYFLPSLIAGVVTGLLLALAAGRTVTPRRDVVEIEVSPSRRRRISSSSDVVRRSAA